MPLLQLRLLQAGQSVRVGDVLPRRDDTKATSLLPLETSTLDLISHRVGDGCHSQSQPHPCSTLDDTKLMRINLNSDLTRSDFI